MFKLGLKSRNVTIILSLLFLLFSGLTTINLFSSSANAANEGSISLDGTGYISYPASDDYNFGTGNLTVEWWQKYNTSGMGAYPRVFSLGCYPSNRLQASFEMGTLYIGFGSQWALYPSLSSSTYQNKWSHFALVRNGSTLSIYQNGNLLSSNANVASSLDLSSQNLFIGAEGCDTSQTKFSGIINGFRIVKSALYTSNFTPTIGYSGAANTVIELLGNTNAVTADTSGNNRTPTTFGGVTSTTDYPTFTAPPTITSLATTSGTTSGGTSVTISGTNLSGVTGITFGGTSGASISSNTSTSVTVITPARSAGAVSVVVTTAGGSATATNAFTYIAPPTISSTSITGTANIGQTLTASLSLGGGSPTSTSYQWSSSDTSSGTYSDISGATSSTYVIPTAQVGKYIKLTASVSNSSGSASATSSATARVNDGLFLRYDAGNSSSYSGSGTTVNDVSGAGLGGTLTGASSTYPGFVSTYGKSFSLNATNSQHIDIADIPAISFANGFTATAWANFGSANSFERIVDLGNGQASSNIIFGRFGTDNDLFVDIWDGATQKGYCRATNAIQSGWAHYAVTLSGSTCIFYVNGASVTGTNYLSITNPVSAARNANFIGKSNWTADGFFESGIARVSLWNRALSSTEVAARATAETPSPEVVLSTSSISVARGSAITNLSATTYGGTATSFSISPSLPTGLSFNTSTGTVSGTPSVGLSSTTFTITANGVTGSPTATFTLAVSATALSGASSPTVSATSGSATSITVSFTSVTNASSHTVRVYQNDGSTLVSTSTNFTSGSTVTGLTANTSYRVSLQAIGDGTSYSTSSESTKASVTTNVAAVSPTISSHPANTSANVGATATFSVSSSVSDSGTRSYQWQTSTDGTSWSNVGSNSSSYTTSTLAYSDNGLLVRITITNTKNGTTSTTTSNNATLTVNLITLSTPQIYSYALGSNSTNSITATWGAVSNASSYTVRVFQSDGTTLVSTTNNVSSGSTITGLTPSTAYKFSVQAVGNGTTYANSSQSALTSLTTRAAAVSPSIGTHPSSQNKSAGSTATFTVAASRTDSGTLSYQWQTSTDGSTWSNVGTNSTSYTTGTLSDNDAGLDVRVVVTNSINGTTATTTSNTASISIVTYSALLTTQSESLTSADAWIVRSNVRYAHQFTAGGAGTINIFKTKLSSTQNYPSQVKIVIYSDNNNAVGSKLGELTYDSITSLNASYTGSVSIPSAGNYWFEIQPTAEIANHYYNGTSSSNSTGSATGWLQLKGNVASGGNSVSWSYFSGTPYTYPMIYIGTIASTISAGSVSTISPSTGPTSGGTVVTITGTVLTNTTGVTFGGSAGTSLTVNSSTSITVTTPAHAAGAVDVVVTTSTKTITKVGGFTYYGAPTIGSASISGTLNSGQVLTANSASLGGGPVSSTTYQWQVSDSSSGTYSDISGATSSTYTLTNSEVNKYIKVVITVTNTVGSNSATSSASNQIAAALSAPTLTGAAISGTTTQGQVLTASVQGAGGGAATTTTYQWSRADSSGGTYTNISGATNSTYTLTSTDVGKYIKVTIAVSNAAGGPNSATSSATSAIAIIAPTIASASFSGTTTTGQTLTATAGSLGGGAIASTNYQWKSATTSGGVYSDISGATGSTYVLTSNEAGRYIKVTITVTNNAGSASATSNASSAAVISNSPTPTITSISPNAGSTAGGTSVTISGTNLSTVSSVTFDGAAATISTKTSTQLIVSTPAHSAGAVNVVVTNTAGSVTSTNGFTYATAPTTRSWTATPSITTGTNGDPFSVTYRAVCTTPQRYGPSMYDLIYVNGGSWAYNSYMGSGTSSDGGYTWTITKNYTITSNGIWKVDAYMRGACWDSYNFTYSTRQFINVGVSGPTITSLSVTSGPTAGGTATVVTGTNLTGVTGITVGGTAATSIRSNTSTSVTFNTPAGTAGAKNVVITTSAGSVTSTNGFTYVAPITVTYDVNGGTGSPSRTTDSYTPNSGGYSLPVVGTMAKTGYTFSGWATSDTSTTAITSPYNPTSTLTVYAIWTARNYTTSYIANGADSGTVPANASNAFGSTVTVAGNSGSLSRAGYTLAGWDTAADGSGTSYILGSGTFTQTASNLILYAEWVPDTYTVSYDVNGSSDSVPASHTGQLANSTVTLRAGVTKANFAFVGWESGGVTYKAGASFTLGTSGASMVAKWIEVYKLSYNLNGTGASGSVPDDFQYRSGDSVIVTSVVPTRAGYTFGGWIDQSGGAHATSSTYTISGTNYLLYAVWNPIAYTVTYALNGGQGTAPTESSKNVNQTFTVATAATKIGSTFAGWSDGTTVYGAGSSYLVETLNIILTAQWTANSYAITYDLAQGTSSVPSALSKAYQASWTLPDAPTRVGYNFSDWYDGANGYAAGASYTLGTASDLTITARWSVIVYYTVTYDLDGGLGTAPTQDPLQNGQSFTLPSDPSKTGNSFTGWSYVGTTYSSGQTITMPAANVTVTALWTATSAGTYAVTYISNGAQTSAPTTPPLAQNATFTVDDGSGLIKNGYIFAGWTYSGTTYTGGETITMPAASVTLSAVWVPAVRATAVTHSVDATSITRGRSITVTYNIGCYTYSATIPTIFENVSTTGESFINDITSALTVIDAGYNWTVTRVYTLSNTGTYTVFATVSGGCFSTSTESTSSTVTVVEAPSSGGSSGGSSNSNNASAGSATVAPARTGSIAPVTVVGAKIALVANKNYTLPKLNPTTTLSVEAKTGSSATSTNTTTSQSTGLTSTTTTMLSVNSASKGLSEVKIVENQIAVVPTVGFSGKTEVSITVTDGSSTTTVTVPVTVLPEPVKDPTVTPITARQTKVTWEASPNAESYQVIVDGKTACKAATDSCDVKKILGPNADVQVVANGGDATKSDAVDADYEADKSVVLTKLVGTTTGAKLTQNDINMLNKVIATVKSQGFETVTISQITTNRINSAAAKARVEALVNYVKSKSGDPDLVVQVVPAPAKTSMNQIAVK